MVWVYEDIFNRYLAWSLFLGLAIHGRPTPWRRVFVHRLSKHSETVHRTQAHAPTNAISAAPPTTQLYACQRLLPVKPS